jgi:serine/threonine-protein kinase
MHEAGFAHLDLKPANVMICRDGTLRIIDFGLAAEIEPKGGFLSGLTPLIGTPQYMAPEQVRNKRCDARTDIYSVGVMLYEMLAGVIPFPGEDPWASAHLKVTGDPVAPRAINPVLTLESEEIVLKAMRRPPADRYQDARSFARDLAAPEHVHVTGLSLRLQAPRWRLSLTGTPILAGVLAGVGFLVFLAGVFFLMLHHKGR